MRSSTMAARSRITTDLRRRQAWLDWPGPPRADAAFPSYAPAELRPWFERPVQSGCPYGEELLFDSPDCLDGLGLLRRACDWNGFRLIPLLAAVAMECAGAMGEGQSCGPGTERSAASLVHTPFGHGLDLGPR